MTIPTRVSLTAGYSANSGTSAKGTKYASVLCKSNSKDEKFRQYVKVTAFGDLADKIAGIQEGDVFTANGEIQISRWTAKDGEQKSGLQIIARGVDVPEIDLSTDQMDIEDSIPFA